MFLALIILNFSYAVYKNYENAKLGSYLDLDNLSISLNEDITKNQLEKCLKGFSNDLEDSINGII